MLVASDEVRPGDDVRDRRRQVGMKGRGLADGDGRLDDADLVVFEEQSVIARIDRDTVKCTKDHCWLLPWLHVWIAASAGRSA